MKAQSCSGGEDEAYFCWWFQLRRLTAHDRRLAVLYAALFSTGAFYCAHTVYYFAGVRFSDRDPGQRLCLAMAIALVGSQLSPCL